MKKAFLLINRVLVAAALFFFSSYDVSGAQPAPAPSYNINGNSVDSAVQLCWNGAAFVVCGSSGSAGTSPLAYATSTSASVGTTSTSIVAAGAYTRSLQVCTLLTSTTNVWLNPTGGAAVVGAGVPVWAGGGCTSFGSLSLPMPTSAITAITDSSSAQIVTVAGG